MLGGTLASRPADASTALSPMMVASSSLDASVLSTKSIKLAYPSQWMHGDKGNKTVTHKIARYHVFPSPLDFLFERKSLISCVL